LVNEIQISRFTSYEQIEISPGLWNPVLIDTVTSQLLVELSDSNWIWKVHGQNIDDREISGYSILELPGRLTPDRFTFDLDEYHGSTSWDNYFRSYIPYISVYFRNGKFYYRGNTIEPIYYSIVTGRPSKQDGFIFFDSIPYRPELSYYLVYSSNLWTILIVEINGNVRESPSVPYDSINQDILINLGLPQTLNSDGSQLDLLAATPCPRVDHGMKWIHNLYHNYSLETYFDLRMVYWNPSEPMNIIYGDPPDIFNYRCLVIYGQGSIADIVVLSSNGLCQSIMNDESVENGYSIIDENKVVDWEETDDIYPVKVWNLYREDNYLYRNIQLRILNRGSNKIFNETGKLLTYLVASLYQIPLTPPDSLFDYLRIPAKLFEEWNSSGTQVIFPDFLTPYNSRGRRPVGLNVNEDERYFTYL